MRPYRRGPDEWERSGDGEGRGTVAVGTLVVFLAMVLLAAVAAGVLIDAAGPRQSDTGERATNQLQITASTGRVAPGGAGVDVVNLTVKTARGTETVDLSSVTATWVEASGSYRLETAATGSGADATFATVGAGDADGSALIDPDDRAVLVFDLAETAPNVGTPFAGPLAAGERATLTLTTPSGAASTVRLVVPDSLPDTGTVPL